jgi:hypothetical protein
MRSADPAIDALALVVLRHAQVVRVDDEYAPRT